MPKTTLTKAKIQTLLETLQNRIEKHPSRHKGLAWAAVQARLEANPKALWSLNEMEKTGGEPDIIAHDPKSGQLTFCDCSPESPSGRRSLCYDPEGQKKREKEGIKMAGNVLTMAAAMSVEPLDEDQYRHLQTLGQFDLKSQSWLKTPPEIHALGGAIFADRRFNRVFVYHNTTPCFYKARAFRSSLKV
jgi:hypothetical protein